MFWTCIVNLIHSLTDSFSKILPRIAVTISAHALHRLLNLRINYASSRSKWLPKLAMSHSLPPCCTQFCMAWLGIRIFGWIGKIVLKTIRVTNVFWEISTHAFTSGGNSFRRLNWSNMFRLKLIVVEYEYGCHEKNHNHQYDTIPPLPSAGSTWKILSPDLDIHNALKSHYTVPFFWNLTEVVTSGSICFYRFLRTLPPSFISSANYNCILSWPTC